MQPVHCKHLHNVYTSKQNQTEQDHQALLKAKYCLQVALWPLTLICSTVLEEWQWWKTTLLLLPQAVTQC